MSDILILFKNISPLTGSNNLGIIFIRVVLPAPEVPIIALTFLPSIVQEKFSKTEFST